VLGSIHRRPSAVQINTLSVSGVVNQLLLPENAVGLSTTIDDRKPFSTIDNTISALTLLLFLLKFLRLASNALITSLYNADHVIKK